MEIPHALETSRYLSVKCLSIHQVQQQQGAQTIFFSTKIWIPTYLEKVNLFERMNKLPSQQFMQRANGNNKTQRMQPKKVNSNKIGKRRR